MNTHLLSTASPVPEAIPPLVVREVDLGRHLLLIRADNSIELCDLCDEAHSGTGKVLVLNHEEAYRLYSVLHEMYKTP